MARTDAEVIADARRIYAELQRTPRWHQDNDRLLRAWGAVCAEYNQRGLTDAITDTPDTRDTRLRMVTSG